MTNKTTSNNKSTKKRKIKNSSKLKFKIVDEQNIDSLSVAEQKALIRDEMGAEDNRKWKSGEAARRIKKMKKIYPNIV